MKLLYRKWGKIRCRENFVGEDYEIKRNKNFQMRNILYTNIYLWYAPFLKITNQVYLSSGQVPRDSIVCHNSDSISVFLISSLSDALQFFSNCCLPNAFVHDILARNRLVRRHSFFDRALEVKFSIKCMNFRNFRSRP